MGQWDFAADVSELLGRAERGTGPRSMLQMMEAAEDAVLVGRSDPTGLQSWLNDNAVTLVGQQILVMSVHAQSSADIELPRVLREWSARAGHPTVAEAVDWLKEEHPALLRAWLLSRVEELVGAEMTDA